MYHKAKKHQAITIPVQRAASSKPDTPACKNPPPKLSLLMAVVCFKKPSVLSELRGRHSILSYWATFSAKYPSTVAEAALVGPLGFLPIPDHSTWLVSRKPSVYFLRLG